MARTSWVRSLRALTVGSLSTIPSPLAYTRVLAVPRSMARSLARVSPLAVPRLAVRRQRPQLSLEAVDRRLDRLRLAVAEPDEQAGHRGDDDRTDEVQEVGHVQPPAFALTSPSGAAPVAQSLPPAQVSFFQIGTVALSVSIANRAASKASPRWGVLATTTTEVSPSRRWPVRCKSASRPVIGHRARV